MKKFIALTVAFIVIFSLVACVQDPTVPPSSSDTSGSNETNSNPSETKPSDSDSSNPSNSETNPSGTNPSNGDSSGDPNPGTETNPPDTNVTIDKEYMLGIIDRIYRAAEGSVYKGYYLGEYRDEMIKQGNISEKNSARYFGTTLEFEIAVYSESNMEAVAYSMCLLKAKDGANIEQIKTAIKDNADPNKWECVTAESVVVETNGDYVILIMADTSEATALKNAFLSLNLG